MHPQKSGTYASLRGSLPCHSLESSLASRRISRCVACSCLKMTPFLRFHNCQQQSRSRVEKCSCGTWAGLHISSKRLASASTGMVNPMADQNVVANGQLNIMWLVLSSSAPQTSQVELSTIMRFCRLLRHCILFRVRSPGEEFHPGWSMILPGELLPVRLGFRR